VGVRDSRRAIGCAGLALAVLVAGACERRTDYKVEREVDHSLITVDHERMNLRHDLVGYEPHESRATFVLVDAEHAHPRDLNVTLAGTLLDADGAKVGTLRPASLRIPAGGVRTFALVDTEQAERPTAVRADVRVTGAWSPDYAEAVRISERRVREDQGRVVVAATVENTTREYVVVIVLASFYDAEGVPVLRPNSVLRLSPETSRPVQFVGPPGSVRGHVFIGDIAF
jgi:hypothetical protein